MRIARSTIALLAFAVPVLAVAAQEQPVATGQETAAEAPKPATIEVSSASLELEVGQTAQLEAVVKDADGVVIDEAVVVFFSLSRRSVGVTPAGEVEAFAPGDFELVARVPSSPDVDPRRDRDGLSARVAVHIPTPPLAQLGFARMPGHYYANTTIRPDFDITDVSGAVRTEVRPELSSSDSAVVEITPLGHLRVVAPGTATITATAESVSDTLEVKVVANPIADLALTSSASAVRTGDVVFFTAAVSDGSGRAVPELPVQYAFRARTVEHGAGEPPSGLITDDGRFVADLPGEYTIVASAGDRSATAVVAVRPRQARREIELLGQARVKDRKTSDLWVWEAPDGRDYAITGTWGAAGHAYIWDVTDPRNMQMIDMVKVDARTVNDVKVSENGRIAVISREGASDRKNGLVILDVSAPLDGVTVLARYDDELTGGVHNTYIYQDHVYALSAGRRYDVISIEDPENPQRVGRFELDSPGHSIHDVWITDGIAASSNWADGVVLTDVGGGGKGGSPTQPVEIGRYAYPSGWNHAAFPYRSKSNGKFYVFAGDEAFPAARNPLGTNRFEGPPVQAAGWIHVIEFEEGQEAREIARYQVPYGGTHNFWVEDDVLYVAYYNAGLRVVDVSGDMLGDLYRQGREIAYFLPDDPQGFKPNARRTWGTMPHKGNIFLADNNSGLWAVRLKPAAEDVPRP